jgi:hypothetical protein
MTRFLFGTCALSAMLVATSCTHVEVALPGVLDLRSDASELAGDRRPSTTPVEVEREGMDATFGGAGPSAAGPGVSVEGRVWWLASFFRLADGGVDEGLRAVLGAHAPGGNNASRALRNVVVTEEITGAESIAFYCLLPVPCAAAFLPTRTVRWTATRVVIPVEPVPVEPTAPVDEVTP